MRGRERSTPRRACSTAESTVVQGFATVSPTGACVAPEPRALDPPGSLRRFFEQPVGRRGAAIESSGTSPCIARPAGASRVESLDLRPDVARREKPRARCCKRVRWRAGLRAGCRPVRARETRVPCGLIRLLVIAVEMISRRSRWRFKTHCEALLLHRRGEISPPSFRGQIRILRNVGVDQRLVQPDLAVTQGDGEFRAASEPSPALRRSAIFLIGRAGTPASGSGPRSVPRARDGRRRFRRGAPWPGIHPC